MLINCFWVSGKYKGNGHGKELYQECVTDAKDMNGIVVVAGNKKQPFMSEKKFFHKQGFELCDTAEPFLSFSINLLKRMHLSLNLKNAQKMLNVIIKMV